MINYRYLIEVYIANLQDAELYLKNRSTHWDEWYGENKKFFKLENLVNFRNNRMLSARLDDSNNLPSKLDLYELLSKILLLFIEKNKIRKISNFFLNISNK